MRTACSICFQLVPVWCPGLLSHPVIKCICSNLSNRSVCPWPICSSNMCSQQQQQKHIRRAGCQARPLCVRWCRFAALFDHIALRSATQHYFVACAALDLHAVDSSCNRTLCSYMYPYCESSTWQDCIHNNNSRYCLPSGRFMPIGNTQQSVACATLDCMCSLIL